MLSPSRCLSSNFLFLPIEDGETFVKYMISAASFTFQALLPQHLFFQISNHTRKSQETSRKVTSQKNSLQNILFIMHTTLQELSFLMHRSHSTFFFLHILYSYQKIPKKFTSLLHSCRPLFAIRALPTCG